MCRVGTTLIRVACHVKTHNSNMLPSLPLGLKDYKRELKSLHSYLKTKMPTEVLMPLGNTFPSCNRSLGLEGLRKALSGDSSAS